MTENINEALTAYQQRLKSVLNEANSISNETNMITELIAEKLPSVRAGENKEILENVSDLAELISNASKAVARDIEQAEFYVSKHLTPEMSNEIQNTSLTITPETESFISVLSEIVKLQGKFEDAYKLNFGDAEIDKRLDKFCDLLIPVRKHIGEYINESILYNISIEGNKKI